MAVLPDVLEMPAESQAVEKMGISMSMVDVLERLTGAENPSVGEALEALRGEAIRTSQELINSLAADENTPGFINEDARGNISILQEIDKLARHIDSEGSVARGTMNFMLERVTPTLSNEDEPTDIPQPSSLEALDTQWQESRLRPQDPNITLIDMLGSVTLSAVAAMAEGGLQAVVLVRHLAKKADQNARTNIVREEAIQSGRMYRTMTYEGLQEWLDIFKGISPEEIQDNLDLQPFVEQFVRGRVEAGDESVNHFICAKGIRHQVAESKQKLAEPAERAEPHLAEPQWGMAR